jgi:hypothetical protein
MDRQEDGSAGVRGVKERYWMRFLKGMVTDRNSLRLAGQELLEIGHSTSIMRFVLGAVPVPVVGLGPEVVIVEAGPEAGVEPGPVVGAGPEVVDIMKVQQVI